MNRDNNDYLWAVDTECTCKGDISGVPCLECMLTFIKDLHAGVNSQDIGNDKE